MPAPARAKIKAEPDAALPLRWPELEEDAVPLHVSIGSGAVLRGVENGEEVARIPEGRGVLGLQVLDRREGRLVVTPSRRACSTEARWAGAIEIEFALDESSLIPVAGRSITRRFPDGTELEIAAGAPLFPRAAGRFELVLDNLSLELDFEEDPTVREYRPKSVRQPGKPSRWVAWGPGDRSELFVGPYALRRPSASTPIFELIDARAGLLRSRRDCAWIVARIEPLPSEFAELPSTPARELEMLEEGELLYWPGGAWAGRVRARVELPRAQVPGAAEGLRCLDFDPLVLCLRADSAG